MVRSCVPGHVCSDTVTLSFLVPHVDVFASAPLEQNLFRFHTLNMQNRHKAFSKEVGLTDNYLPLVYWMEYQPQKYIFHSTCTLSYFVILILAFEPQIFSIVEHAY